MSDFDTRKRVDYTSTGDTPLHFLAHAKGFVMVRYTGFHPYVITEKEWLNLPLHKRARRPKND